MTERIGQAPKYWLATTHPNGQPHMTPVWGVWLGDVFYFSTGPRSRKARNLSINPHYVVSPELADKAIILEGIAMRVTNTALLRQVADAYSAKYQWPIEPTREGVRDQNGNEGPVFAVRGGNSAKEPLCIKRKECDKIHKMINPQSPVRL